MTTKVLIQMNKELKNNLDQLAKELTEKGDGVRRITTSELIREGIIEVLKKYKQA